MSRTLVIAGASHAGAHIASFARQQGFRGRVILIGKEPHLPYQRPPLSKGYLLGILPRAHLAIRPKEFYVDQRIELLLETEVVRIDAAAKEVFLDSGERIPYDFAAIATGARNRMLEWPGADLEGVLYLRDVDEADRLRELAASATHVAIIGGGFIGLEAAASLRTVGLKVTVIELADRLLKRVFPPVLSEFVRDLHTKHGVRCLVGRHVERLRGSRGRVVGVELAGGETITCDLVLIGIGVVPNVELAAKAGLRVMNGVVVDGDGRTSDPSIFAAGDCTSSMSRWFGVRNVLTRLESIQNAFDQARSVACAVSGSPNNHHSVPWFWSDQYSTKFQMVGLSQTWQCDEVVLRGEPADGAFSVFYFHGRRLVAVDSVNRPKDHMLARRMLVSAMSLTPEQAADCEQNLRSLIEPSSVPANARV